MANNRMKSLENQVKSLQLSKLELLRATSTEIERLRQIIRSLTNPQNTDSSVLDSFQYEPLTSLEIQQIQDSFDTLQANYDDSYDNNNDHHDSDSDNAILDLNSHDLLSNDHETPQNPDSHYNNNNNNTKRDSNPQPEPIQSLEDAYQQSQPSQGDAYRPPIYHTSAHSEQIIINTFDTSLDKNEPIIIEPWTNNNDSSNRLLGSLHENEEHHYKNTKEPDEFLTEAEHKQRSGNHTREDLIRLNTKRMSYKGFEFSDFGFMTTDFDQLCRGHTQWVNQVLHHPVQNGICLTASDDWCVMFWRFRKSKGTEDLKQEKVDSYMNKLKRESLNGTNDINNDQNIEAQRHLVGEIELFPVLKINTGLEVKSITMSSDGVILACTCFDEEEDEGNPELQLYFDREQRWCFKHHHFHPYYSKQSGINQSVQQHTGLNKEDIIAGDKSVLSGERVITRKIISLPFEPVSHALAITRDNKYVFIPLYSSEAILEEFKEELDDDEYKEKYADHTIPLVCVNVHNKELRECTKVYEFMAHDEHITCIGISPNGARIAMGTNHGHLIVTGVLNITGDIENSAETDFNPILQKTWTSHEDMKDFATHSEDEDGSLTSLDWSEDSDWIICGHASGAIKFWKRGEEKRMSVMMHKTIGSWMKKARVKRQTQMFQKKYSMEGMHIEAVNSISIRGSVMISGADDGCVIIHDLMETFVDGLNVRDSSPITVGKIDRIHGGRMVNSVCLSRNYSEDNLLIPSAAHFMISSGADNVVHCLSLLDVFRDQIRRKHYAETQDRIDL